MPADPDGAALPVSPFRPPTPVVIGLVGGIAAGKSTVAGFFAARGLCHVDADRLAREVATEPAALTEIREQLGEQFVVQGRLEREALATLVFQDPARRQQLEQILHPRIRARIRAALDAARAAGQSVLLDVPLLFEGGLFESCDTIVFVAAGDATRAERARRRGWRDEELGRREQHQLPLAEKRQRSDHVIDNDTDLLAAEAAVAALLHDLESAT